MLPPFSHHFPRFGDFQRSAARGEVRQAALRKLLFYCEWYNAIKKKKIEINKEDPEEFSRTLLNKKERQVIKRRLEESYGEPTRFPTHFAHCT